VAVKEESNITLSFSRNSVRIGTLHENLIVSASQERRKGKTVVCNCHQA
jgi:hypothetical protein